MNKDNIKKSLVQCSDFVYCDDCPYFNWEDMRCRDKLQRDALNLITEQEKEIERLRTTLGQCNAELNSALESLKSQCREIGELKDDYAKLQELFAQYQMASDKEIRVQVKQAKIEVLNKLKEKCKFDGHTVAVYKNDIDELIKEVKE